MKSRLLFTLCCFLFSISSFAQNASLKGVVVDTSAHLKLANTTVSVLRVKDSTLVKFIRADQNGAFLLNQLPEGDFFLLLTYPGYADYVEPFTLDSSRKNIDFGRLELTTKAILLANVMIRGTAAAIKIKGDTTEFNAAAYVIQPNSKVEDLLKQLPGIQVDQDGKITAQGKTVNKVLVDGEEFFGDDPTLVTKNIRGDMVDKVQLYDKKSDQATFTGIDDDKKEKTINIKLKEDKKNGYFGKVDLGAATDKYYQGQAMVNVFKNKKKFSAYGTVGNTGKIGLGWQEKDQYSSAGDIEVIDGGMMILNNSGYDELESFDGQFGGQGIPLTRNGGVHYDAKWNADKEFINTNYKFGSMNLSGDKEAISQNNLPDGIINTQSNEYFDNYMFRQKLDLVYQLKLDTTSTIKITMDGTLKNNETRNEYDSRSLRDHQVLLNKNERTVANDGHSKVFNAKILWTKKLKKKGRTLSLQVTESNQHNDSEGFLYSLTTYYHEGVANDSIVDQFKTSAVKSANFGLNLAYTEPLSKSMSLVLNYGLGISSNDVDSRSFNKDGLGKYSLLDTLYSNTYGLEQLSNQAGAIFNIRTEKVTLNFGAKVSTVKFEQQDEQRNSSYARNFMNWNPQVSANYRLSRQSSFGLYYSGRTQQPSINEVNPLRVNTDPLNITLGNPELKPSFNNSFSLNYYDYKVLTGQNIALGGGYNFTANPIVGDAETDTAGRSVYQSVNISDKKTSNFYLYANGSRKIKVMDLNVGVDLYFHGMTHYSYRNKALNESKSHSYSGNISLSKHKEKQYDFSLRFGPNYQTNESSLQKNVNDNGWGYQGSGSFSLYLPLKLGLFSDANYEYRAKTQSFDTDFKRLIWNARLSKSLLKSEKLRLGFSVNDLLNQNKGFNRSASASMIIQNSYTTIRRYYMATLTWDFNKMGGTAKKQ